MNTGPGSGSLPGWLLAVGVVTLVCGIAVSFAVVGGGVDFPVLYVMGRGALSGANVYLPEQTAAFPREFGVKQTGMFYPPATGFVVLPLALLPYSWAKWTFAALIDVAVVSGIRGLVRLAAPEASPSLWMIAAGVVLASAAMRWGLMLLQVAPLVFGLLCWFVILLHTRKQLLAVGVAILALSLKMTLSLPFAGLLALRRRWWSAAVVGTAWLSLNAIGFWRMGAGSFADYRRGIAGLGGLGSENSPDLWQPIALPRLDWMSLFYGLTQNAAVAQVAALALSGACFLWLAWHALRSRRPDDLSTTTLFLGALVCLGSLAVYHHQYDAVLFFAPALLGLLLFDRKHQLGFWLSAPLVVMILVLPIGKAQAVLGSALGLTGVGLLKLCFPVAFTLALVGCLLLIRSNARPNLHTEAEA